MNIIDGKIISRNILEDLKHKLKNMSIIPKLVIIQVGDNQASNVYVRNKLKLSNEVGINTVIEKLPENTSQDDLIKLLNKLNNDKDINGILVQLPLPKHIDESLILESINPNKDVDCFNSKNVGKLWSSKRSYTGFKPCTPAGIIELLKHSNISISGKNVVIVGRSNIVGKPLAALFLMEDATVTICHSKTNNLKQICANADILVAAIGSAKFINKDYVNDHMTVIDVGMCRDENNKLCGDVDFDDVKDIVKYITPVPGGVGPMTITMLLMNLIKSCQ